MRRRGRSATSYRGTNTVSEDDVMDEDDQSELVEEIFLEAEAQMRRFQSYFKCIGVGAMTIALVDPFLCQEECEQQIASCWTHSIFSSILHVAAVALARNQNDEQDFRWFLTLFGLVVLPMILWIMDLFHEDVEHFHIGLLVSNMVTFAGCILLRWDDQSTSTAINDLDDLKYAHKTL